MKVRSINESGIISFAQYVGSGDCNGVEFSLSVTATANGTLLGMPRFTFGETVVTFELNDLLPMAMEAAGIGEAVEHE